MLNASVTACSSSIGRAAANGDRGIGVGRYEVEDGRGGGKQRASFVREAARRRRRCAGWSGSSRGLTRGSRVEHTHS